MFLYSSVGYLFYSFYKHQDAVWDSADKSPTVGENERAFLSVGIKQHGGLRQSLKWTGNNTYRVPMELGSTLCSLKVSSFFLNSQTCSWSVLFCFFTCFLICYLNTILSADNPLTLCFVLFCFSSSIHCYLCSRNYVNKKPQYNSFSLHIPAC